MINSDVPGIGAVIKLENFRDDNPLKTIENVTW